MNHLDTAALHAFLNRTLAPAELIAADLHLSECPACTERLLAMTPINQSFDLLDDMLAGDPEHLSDREIVAAAAGEPALSHDAAQHLERCALCQESVADLRDFASAQPAKVVSISSATAQPTRRFAPRVIATWGSIAAILLLGVATLLLRKPHTDAAPEAVLVASLQDNGATLGLDASGQLHGATAIPAEYRGLLADTLHAQALPAKQWGKLPPHTGLRGTTSAPSFEVLTPVHETTLTTAPLFRWQAFASAKTYRVEVYDDAFHLVARSPELKTTSWQSSAGLASGKTYNWVVMASTPGGDVQAPKPPQAAAIFAIASEQACAEFALAQGKYAGDHLLLATLAARAGDRTEARTQLDLLERDNPASPLVQRLKTSLAALP